MFSDTAILRKIEQQPKQNAGLKQLVRELRAHGAERRHLEERLNELVKTGKLRESDGRYQIPRAVASRNQAIGRLTMHRDGYGFVIPDADEVRARIQGDIYVSPHAIGNAMHGDRVLVDIGPVRSDGRAEGKIARVLDRAHPSVVGIFHYGRKYNFVTPIDAKITQDIMIPAGEELPKKEEAEGGAKGRKRSGLDAHRVVGSEAHRRTEWDDLEGVAVDVEITDWPTPTQNPKGRVLEILGYEDDFGVDVEIIIRKHHLPHRFPVEVLEEAQQFDATIPAPELQHRRDFCSVPIVTIDGETARDFDDAVTVHMLPNGNYELQVHIADVAQFVTDDSALDREARLRGNSVYFPDRAIPMLPIELSTDLCSLRPKVDRLVMSCVMEVDHQGEVLGFELCEGVIRSSERMTYTDVNAILEGDAKLRAHYAPLIHIFEMMRDLATILNRKRARRGSIDFDLPEPVIEFDENGMMQGITRSERNFAHRLIEEFMLSANECVASYLEKKHIAAIYRIHEKPDPKRVFDFETIAATFGYSLGVGALPMKRMEMKSDRRSHHQTGRQPTRIEIPEDVHITPRMYQKLTEKIAGKPEERILSFLMLRSLKQARYSEENAGHFALAAPTYTHFTSPIRRYPDLIVHRLLKDALREHPEFHDGQVPVGRGTPVGSERPTAWSKRADKFQKEASPWAKGSAKKSGGKSVSRDGDHEALSELIPLPLLHEIADESSASERRADDAERELMEWKKVKFMSQRIGEEFEGLIISVTKFGFFVELKDLFIEGLVPLSTLTDDRYTFHENTRQIIGQRTRKTYTLGETVRVIVDRIDPVMKKINFALMEAEPVRAPKKKRKRS